ncbi:GntR family transcriptional regulator [Trinickia terrae]|uniref:GntR family transcriptional regulator n=1 Tax=Trinickia terrae TaxID=2571161 RepID=A0A4U1HZW8_9BURK|nr:GntR family transcriptional regulator [Trinickia terrae]TKC85926.1 GntR family transcriptional regulator [Trinickia terrae]
MTPADSTPSVADAAVQSELSVTDRIVAQIRDEIIQGNLAPGTALVENDLTNRYDVSRNTLREALRQLCREGLAVHYRHRGVVVRTLTRADVRDIFRVRRALELQAVAQPDTPDASVLQAMFEACESSEAAVLREDWRSVGTHSLIFHQHIVELLGSPLIDQFFRTILAQLRLMFAVAPDEARFQTPWVERDRQILELLAAGERKRATARLTDYLKRSEDALLDLL